MDNFIKEYEWLYKKIIFDINILLYYIIILNQISSIQFRYDVFIIFILYFFLFKSLVLLFNIFFL